MSPSDFWQLDPREFWWWVQAKCPQAFNQADELADLYELLTNGKH